MNYLLHILLVACWSLLAGGSPQKQTEAHPALSAIEADVTSNAELQLSEYFENFKMLKLPSDGSMDRIGTIRYENDCIYISDRRTLFVFSLSGELLLRFDDMGQGALVYGKIPDFITNKTELSSHKFAGIMDFIVDGEHIVVLNRDQKKLLVYNHLGEYISTQKLDFFARAISPMVNDSYFLYCGNEYGPEERHKLRRRHAGIEDSTYLPIDENQSKYLHIAGSHYFFQNQDTIYFFEVFNDTVYASIGGGCIKPSFYLDFKGKNVPASFFEKRYANIMEFFSEFHTTSYAYGGFDFAVYDNFMMFGSYYLKNKKLTIFDRKNQVSKTFATLKDDVYFNGLTIPMSEFSYHADRHLVVPIDAHKIVEWRDKHPVSEEFKEMVGATRKDDNPILLVFDFKK